MIVSKESTASIIRAAKAVADLPLRVGTVLLSLRQALADVVKGGDARNYLRAASRTVAEVVLALSFQECMVRILVERTTHQIDSFFHNFIVILNLASPIDLQTFFYYLPSSKPFDTLVP
jgi:hypothetical protein